MSDIIERLSHVIMHEFPHLETSVESDFSKITIPPKHQGFGAVVIEDYLDDEVIVYVGTRSHWHVGYYEENDVRATLIASICVQVIDFLRRLFQDEIVVWSEKRGGGHCLIGNLPRSRTLFGNKRDFWVWSGRHITCS